MPSENGNTYNAMHFAMTLARETLKENDDDTIRIIFGKQDGTKDCFHRGIDLIARVCANEFDFNTLPTMPYKRPSTVKGKRVTIPKQFYGGI